MQVRKLKLNQIVEARCADIVSEGLGISHILSSEYVPLTGFVLGVMPGETFLARITRVKSNHFHAVILPIADVPDQWIGALHTRDEISHHEFAIFDVSAARIEPACKIFTRCGSCKLLHMSYENSLALKKKWLMTQLERNHIAAPDINVVESPRKTHYRNHVQIHINKHGERGFYAPYSYTTRAFPDKGCLLFHQDWVDAIFPEELQIERCVRARIDYVSPNTSVWSLYSREEKSSTFTYSVEYPEGSITRVTIPNSAFFQTNTSIIPLWLSEVNNLVKNCSHKSGKLKILELFSGFGFITRSISLMREIEVLGIDILKPVDLDQIILGNNVYDSTVSDHYKDYYLQIDLTILNKAKENDLERIRSFNPDIILINPPRSGFLPQQMQFLFQTIYKENKVPIIYSSCNGATFARDCVTLRANGYNLAKLTLFDFFPWTSHYEIIGMFS